MEYEQLTPQGELVLQLHAWDDPSATSTRTWAVPTRQPYGNGVLLWFQTDDFDAAVERARALGAEILEEPHVNPNARHREIWLRDPDGYVVVIAGARGDV